MIKSLKTANDHPKPIGLKNYLIKGTSGAFILKAGNVFLWLIVNIILARRMKPDHFGIYAYVVSLINVLCMPAALGLPAYILREVASYRVNQQYGLLKGLIKRADQAVIIAGSCLILLSAIVSTLFFSLSERIIAFYIALPLLIVNPITTLCQAALRGFRRIIVGLLPDNLLRPGLFLILLTILWYTKTRLDEKSALSMLLIASFIGLLYSFYMRHKSISGIDRTNDVQYQTMHWIRGALPFIFLDSLMVINNQTDIIMIGIFRTSSEVGLYKVAAQGAQIVVFILFAVNMTIGPVISELYHSNQMKNLQRLVTSSSRVIFGISAPIALVFIIWGEPIIRLFFGREYVLSSVPLAILCIGQLFNASMGSVGLTLNMTGNEKETVKGVMGSAIINIFLNLFFIPLYGIKGAAVATCISIIFWNAMLTVYLYKRLGVLTLPIKIKKF